MKSKMKRTIPYLFRLSYLYESDYGLLAEEHFHDLVGLETKRVQRSDTLHLLLHMDLTGFEEKRKEDQVLRAVASILFSSTREADAKGWHRYPAVLGVLVTDLIATGNSLHSTKDAIVNRLLANLARTLATSDVERIGFSCQTILSSADSATNVRKTDSKSSASIDPQTLTRTTRQPSAQVSRLEATARSPVR